MWWKDVSRGKDPPGVVNVVVETPMGSRIKYAAAEEHRAMVASKLLAATFAYPANSGFFAQCWGEDGDPLDAMVLGGAPMFPGTVCSARPVAVMRMTDRGQRDDKVLCVLDADPDWFDVKRRTAAAGMISSRPGGRGRTRQNPQTRRNHRAASDRHHQSNPRQRAPDNGG